jgi:hypothetical protein
MLHQKLNSNLALAGAECQYARRLTTKLTTCSARIGWSSMAATFQAEGDRAEKRLDWGRCGLSAGLTCPRRRHSGFDALTESQDELMTL